MRTFLNKHKFIRVITFKKDKSTSIAYHARDSFKPSYLIDPNHIFLGNGYSTIIHVEGQAQSCNPLDFESKYDGAKFQVAINTKIIEDTFTGLKSNKFDLTQMILFLSIAMNFVILYFTLKSNGVF